MDTCHTLSVVISKLKPKDLEIILNECKDHDPDSFQLFADIIMGYHKRAYVEKPINYNSGYICLSCPYGDYAKEENQHYKLSFIQKADFSPDNKDLRDRPIIYRHKTENIKSDIKIIEQLLLKEDIRYYDGYYYGDIGKICEIIENNIQS